MGAFALRELWGWKSSAAKPFDNDRRAVMVLSVQEKQ
jgi:hypothetical protein